MGIPWYTPSSDTAELWTVAKSTSRCNIPASKRSWCAEKGRHPCSHWREWTWIVSIYNIFRTGRTELVKNESGLEEEPARNRFHRWASGRAISVEISCLTVLATALWAPSILCVARGALQLFLLGCCLSWLSLGILVNFLGLCFWTTFLELMDSFRFKRVLHASVARMVAVFQPNFCLLPYYVGEPHVLFMIVPAGPEPVLPARQWTKDLIMAVQVDDKAERSSQTFLVKRELCLWIMRKCQTFFAVNVLLTFRCILGVSLVWLVELQLPALSIAEGMADLLEVQGTYNFRGVVGWLRFFSFKESCALRPATYHFIMVF